MGAKRPRQLFMHAGVTCGDDLLPSPTEGSSVAHKDQKPLMAEMKNPLMLDAKKPLISDMTYSFSHGEHPRLPMVDPGGRALRVPSPRIKCSAVGSGWQKLKQREGLKTWGT